jgi:regulator of protease activity HflC (stomatin/prohibitin superfamily)
MAYISEREKTFDSIWFVRALPNEYLVKVGKERLSISLGGTAFRPFTRHLKVPASSEITEFELECSTSNYLGVIVNGFVSWKIDPDRVETAIRSLDFYNLENPLEKTSGIIRDLARDAVRRSVAELAVNDILTSGDRLKSSIETILSDVSKLGLRIDSIGIRKIFIKSETVYNQLQAG